MDLVSGLRHNLSGRKKAAGRRHGDQERRIPHALPLQRRTYFLLSDPSGGEMDFIGRADPLVYRPVFLPLALYHFRSEPKEAERL